MGFLDNARAQGAQVRAQVGQRLFAQLEPGDELVAWTTGTHLASNGKDMGDESITDLTWLSGPKVFDMLFKGVSLARARKQHIGGEEGSRARSMPIDKPQATLVLGSRHLSLFDTGMFEPREVPLLGWRCPREELASIEQLAVKAHGMVITRITFTDGSFGDWRLMRTDDNAAFWG